jgi:hypothetical protein
LELGEAEELEATTTYPVATVVEVAAAVVVKLLFKR